MKVTLISFGFVHGIPDQCSVVLDARILRDPAHMDGVAEKTGIDPEVSARVLSMPGAGALLDYALGIVRVREAEGKQAFTLGIGCVRGRHRSVAIAETLALALAARVVHRDVLKPVEV